MAIHFKEIVVGVGASVCLGGALYFIVGRKRESRFLRWIGGAPLATLTVLCILAAVIFPYSLVRASVPRYVYEDTFHRKPASDVKRIQSHSWSLVDSAHVYLRFRSTYKTFKEILPQNLARVSYSEYREKMPALSDPAPPPWWSGPNDKTSEIYLLAGDSGKKRLFAREATLMTYDFGTRTIKYCRLGID